MGWTSGVPEVGYAGRAQTAQRAQYMGMLLRNEPTPQAQRLDKNLGIEGLVAGDLILAEVLRGFKDDRASTRFGAGSAAWYKSHSEAKSWRLRQRAGVRGYRAGHRAGRRSTTLTASSTSADAGKAAQGRIRPSAFSSALSPGHSIA